MQRCLKSVFLLCFLSLVLSSCFKNLIKTDTYYQSDFSKDTSATKFTVQGFYNNNTLFGPVAQRLAVFNGVPVFGYYNDNIAELDLNGLSQHYSLRIEYDLYIHDNWNNDLFQMKVNGVLLLSTGFSNNSAVQQAYPNFLGNGSALSPAGAGSYTTQLPGACSLIHSANGTSEYKILMTIQDNSPSFKMILSDAGGFQNQPCQRSWSISNLKITGILSN